ncbi:MAG: beta-N-acetylglucosaminidase [Gemmatimonadetes bacterium]|nr:beta-N-acetylglucosaminidase [Gemmatimonadota bacterium]
MGLVASLCGCDIPEDHSIVPMPRSVIMGIGSLDLNSDAGVYLTDPNDPKTQEVFDIWAAPYRKSGALALSESRDSDSAIKVGIDGQGAAESYRLSVTTEGITLNASDHAGLFYGLQTLSQLMPPDAVTTADVSSFGLPVLEIDDAPRFTYRGVHLDVARHFFPPEFIKHYIDLLALYKINRFHWHLTEDQGWRIEIDQYPKLTEVAAFREQTHMGHGLDEFQGDGVRYGGFYTKEEIREIVAYAHARNIMIIPEIEMPGHATAALAAYPKLGCTEGPFEVAMTWGIFEDIYCPYEETFEFLENVLLEVIELFPGDYIHIGGDEAPKARWEESEYVQDLMVREGFNDVEQVQGYFIRRIDKFLNEHGKRLIGWDEIIEGGLPPNATVMSWRGTIGGIEASRRGHDVVMTPYSHLYLDYYQSADQENEPFAIGGFLPLDTVYSYEPVPSQLRERDKNRIIGAQANVWTEYMKTGEHVEYMLLPRMLALAEVVWSPAEAKDFTSFLKRIEWHLDRFDALGVNYREPDQ